MKALAELMEITFYYEVLLSTIRIMIGFCSGLILSLLLAYIIYRYKLFRIIIYPILEILRPIPNAGWVPIIIIITPTIDTSIFLITFIGAFFPIFINIYNGLKEFPDIYQYQYKLLGLNERLVIIKILLPGIAPFFFNGLMLGISGAWLSLIMAEIINGKSGIGYFTWKNYTLLCYEKVLLGIISMGILGSLSSYIISKIGRKYLHWVKR